MESSSSESRKSSNLKMTNKQIREDYFDQLRSWLTTVHNYQICYNHLQQESLKTFQKQNNSNSLKRDSIPTPTCTEQEATIDPNKFQGYKCKIPPLWKRFTAEFIDFILLSLLKFIVAYFAVDSLEIDFTKYNSIIMQDDFNVDYNTAVEMTSELFFLEVTHRLVVCFYEVYWLQGGSTYHGGATIGKMLLDLSVVRAEKICHIRGQPQDNIALTPGGDLGWKRSVLRSLTKNLFFAFLFPLPFVTAAANQNRCAYDVLCGSMVVESVQPLCCERSELIPIT
ncbi:uncharacterized protein LOC126902671 [Daktulosphaira vitifoliae]|uniref:uncharacterized protein LOC126902671 n=1 Tax=Daktulosphaira vitifoliae TaxID=58002 RepID=UPI0021AAD001|nr:uncharacterized protein LOC126902671 [Daktulosphaira vitifoliae]XP_050536141.1 uncharacterized protein LOC126902671 [Daktulosphaira vitifoliae]XP_050536152.1 uncharacterized protein LOC126902671 [Daktulosphaira vitifoliae]XP_050536163.1 uncharacterized protein LOC126902671 [Daktulosphaira vitifoliae]